MPITTTTATILIAAALAQPGPEPEGFRVTELAPDTWQLTEIGAWHANCLLARMPDGSLVLADTPASGPATERLIEWIAAEFGDGLSDDLTLFVVASHPHADACAGIHQLLLARERGWAVEVWTTERTAEVIEEQGQGIIDLSARSMDNSSPLKADLLATTIAGPTGTFEQRLERRIDGETVVAIDLGHAHAPGNAVVWLPERGVLFGSCAVLNLNASRPGYIGHADLDRWPIAVRGLMDLRPEIVVPGHGSAGGPELLEHTEAAVAAGRRQAELAPEPPAGG